MSKTTRLYDKVALKIIVLITVLFYLNLDILIMSL